MYKVSLPGSKKQVEFLELLTLNEELQSKIQWKVYELTLFVAKKKSLENICYGS